ncbi:MAG: hypothetical protein R3A13_09450 [Bdellovibrionota bacterium]
MGSKYELIYEGPVDNTPETVEKISNVFSEIEDPVAKLCVSTTEVPQIIETAASEVELKELFEKIKAAGGRVQIKSSASEADLGIEIDQEELWQDETGYNPDNILTPEEVEPLDLVLELDLSDDNQLKEKSSEVEVEEKPETLEINPTEDDAPLFTEGQLQDNPEPTFEFSLEDEISEETPEPVSSVEQLDEQLIDASSEQELLQACAEDQAQEVSPPDLGLEFSLADDETIQEQAPKATIKVTQPEEIQAEVEFETESDAVINSVETATKPSQETKNESPAELEVTTPQKLSDLGKKSNKTIIEAKTESIIEDEEEYIEELAEEADIETIETLKKPRANQKQLLTLGFVVLILINVLFFNFVTNDPQEPTLDLTAMQKIQPVTPTTVEIAEAPQAKSLVLKDYFVDIESSTISIKAKFRELDSEIVRSMIIIETPRPPAQSARDKAFKIKPHPWIRKVEVDRLNLKLDAEGNILGNGRARAYIVQDPLSTRIITSAKISGVLVDDVIEATILVSNLDLAAETTTDEIVQIKNVTEDTYDLKLQLTFNAYLIPPKEGEDTTDFLREFKE